MPKMKVTLSCGKEFESKRAAKDWAKGIRDAFGVGAMFMPGSEVYEVLTCMMSELRHDETRNKDGARYFGIEEALDGKATRFYLCSESGLHIAVGFNKIIDESTYSPDQIRIKRFDRASRCEIDPQIEKFRRKHKAKPEQDVDHVDPPYRQILALWLEHTEYRIREIEVIPGINDIPSKFADRQIARQWKVFHASMANLVLVDRRENRQKGGKRIDLSHFL